MKTPTLYAFSTFLCGLVVMAAELSASRLMAPYFGNSLYVWTNLITLVLVALSLGYFFGGILADRRPNPRLYFSMIGLAGLWILLLPFVAPILFTLILELSPNLGWSARYGSLIAIFLLFTVPLFILGMIVPFTLKLSLDQLKGVGTLSGRLSMISTVGSLLGSFLPAFLLLPLLGTTRTFVLLGFLLCVLSVFGLRKLGSLLLPVLGLLLMALVPPAYADERMVDFVDSPYGFVFVTQDEEGVRRLHIDTPLGTQSVYDPEDTLLSDRYYYKYFGVLPALVSEPETVLILGHAGGSFTRVFNEYYPSLELTGVELDPAVTAMAEQYMDLSSAKVSIVHSDARAFLLSTDVHYDLILVDTYHGANIPAHLATAEFFALCAEHLNEGGVLALNAASTEGVFLDTLSNTVASAMGSVWIAPIPDSFNFMLVSQEDGSYTQTSFLPQTLLASWTGLNEEDHEERPYNVDGDVFEDERLSEVELLNEEMFMRLLEVL